MATKIRASNLHTDVKTMVQTMVGENAVDSADVTSIVDANIAAKSTSDISEGSNLYYTDARADARVALVVDAAPGALDTLNELAAALGDDANFSTTVTNSIATKLPLAGGTITGDVTVTTVNATTVDLGNWTVSEESGSLLFATQGVTKMKLDSSGNLDVVGNINSSAYIYSAAALIVNGKTPKLAFDFVNSYYRNSGVDSTFVNSINHSRASSATMVNSSGTIVTVGTGVPRTGHHVYNGSAWVNEGILHESEARTNYVQDSHIQDTNNGMGTFIPTRAVFTQNNYASPDGTTNAAKFAGDGSNNSHKAGLYVQGSGTSPGLTDKATFSVYLKQGTHRYAQVEVMDNAADTNGTLNRFFINIDLQTGTIIGTLEVGSPTAPLSTIENVGNGWYRASATLTKKGDNVRTDGSVSFSNAGAANINPGTNSGANDYFYIWGAQLEVGAAPSSLIPTAGGVVTRAADILTISAAKVPYPAISDYVETTGTELITNGDFSTSDLSQWTAAAGNTLSIVNGRLRVTRDGSTNTYSGAITDFDVTQGSYYQITIETIDGSLSARHRTRHSSSEGYYGNNMSSGTYHFKATHSTLRIDLNAMQSTNTGYFEFDNITLKEINPPAVSIQMSGTMTYADNGYTSEVEHYRWQLSSYNYINSVVSTQTGRTGQSKFNQRHSTSGFDGVAGTNTDYSPGINVPFKIAARHGATFINGAIEGTALTVSTGPTQLADLSSINLQLGSIYMGTVSKFVVWDEDIGDAGIASASL